MQFIYNFFEALITLSNAMAPYILFGLMFAGILHEIVPQDLVSKHLGKDNIFSVIKATLFGIPLPVCSCGVIPLAASIKKSGASKGATLSFLISTPITGVDSIMATYGIFGFLFTIYRVLASMVIALIAGILTNIFDKSVFINEQKFSLAHNVKQKTFGVKSFSQAVQKPVQKSKFSIQRAVQYGFITLLGDIAKPLFFGLLIGALISVAIPQSLSDILIRYSWFSYLLSMAIAVPMYVCATASLPIAASLMLSGVGSIIFGLGLDYIFDIAHIDPKSLASITENMGIISYASSAVLWAFLLYFLSKVYLKKAFMA